MIRGRAAAIGRAGLRGVRRHWLLISVPIALVVIAAYLVAFMLDEPLRRPLFKDMKIYSPTDISGRIDNPNVSALDVVIRLVQNAFFKAILPGFDVEIARAGRLKD